jgi:hypothetical protein
MRKENKHLLKTVISNQELIMKALHIAIPEKKAVVKKAKAVVVKQVVAKKVATKKAVVKSPAKKAPAKATKK